MNVSANWWERFFEGVAVDMWLQAMSPEQTNIEADRVARLLGVPPRAELLDVPCGGGRLSRALAERGYRLTGVDWSAEFIRYATSRPNAQQVNWQRREMRDLPWPEHFDGAFCVGNSFGYLDDEGNRAFLSAVRRTLKPGARFVLETPMVLENLLNHLHERPWWKVGDVYLLIENHYDPATARLDIEYTFISGGRIDVRRGSHRAYGYRELIELIGSAGFDVHPAEPWTREAHTVWFVATAV